MRFVSPYRLLRVICVGFTTALFHPQRLGQADVRRRTPDHDIEGRCLHLPAARLFVPPSQRLRREREYHRLGFAGLERNSAKTLQLLQGAGNLRLCVPNIELDNLITDPFPRVLYTYADRDAAGLGD